ncbi:hypothetical protein [Desulfovibrio desulfuricans]|uniref:hypothetical protein n=1 Tax=Desulfovibrio desulfuricans TaxID=876 RepID=UPI0035B19540
MNFDIKQVLVVDFGNYYSLTSIVKALQDLCITIAGDLDEQQPRIINKNSGSEHRSSKESAWDESGDFGGEDRYNAAGSG